ncbi:MAG: hypothetical protein ACR2OR_17000 [Hyphomicrobiales bacterium]
MSPIKSTIIAAATFAIVGFGVSLSPNSADAGVSNSERLNVCAWYKSRAMSNGRRGLREEAEHYWFLYRECMRYRID